MRKFLVLIIMISSVLIFNMKAHAKTYHYEWENSIVHIPVGSSLEDYKHLPTATLYIDNVAVNDANITYLTEGDWLYYLSDVNTSIVGEYEVWYKAYENNLYRPGTCPGYKCKVKFIVEDKMPPSIRIINNNLKIRRGSDYNLLDNIIVEDNYYDNVDIKLDTNLNIDQLGTYEVNLIAIDNDKNESRGVFNVEVYEDTYPVIGYNNEGNAINVELNSKPDIISNFYAYDEIDGDLSKYIKLPIIDTTKIGLYKYTASVANKVGLESFLEFYVNITDDKKPIITLTNDAVILDYKTDFTNYDFKSYINSIDDNTPVDYNNLIITSNIENKVGNYNVYYMYNDGTYNAQAILNVRLKSYLNPIIECDDITIYESSNFNILDYVMIYDESDPLILDSLDLFDDNVDYNTPGEYYIELYVLNSSGLSATKRVKLTILERNISPLSINEKFINNNMHYIIIICGLGLVILFLSIKKIKAFKNKF